MRKTFQTICLVAALLPLLACGKKRVFNPAPPPDQPPSTAPAPATPNAPDASSDPDPDPGPVRVDDDWLAQADQAYLEKRYPDAIRDYRNYLDNTLAPKKDHAHFRLGLLTAQQGAYDEAISHLNMVLDANVKTETQIQLELLIRLLKRASDDAEEKRDLKQTLKDIMEKLDS